jgi:hypothetical protein
LPKTKKKDGVEQIVAKAFAHPLRVQILIILNERVASPNLLAQELDQSLNLVAYHVTDSEWSRMPQSLRPGLSGAMLKSVFDDIEEAVKSGTLDEQEDRHLSRTPMVVDQQGWDAVSKLLAETLDRVFEIQSESGERLTKSGEEGMLSKVATATQGAPDPAPLAQGVSGAAASGVATTKEKLSSR